MENTKKDTCATPTQTSLGESSPRKRLRAFGLVSKPGNKRKPKHGITEKDIQTRIRNYLGKHCPDLSLWRNNSGTLKDEKGQHVVYGLCPGSADLVGVVEMVLPSVPYPVGRFVALEVKRPGEKATEAQARWLRVVRKRGGFGAVVTSEEEAYAAIKRAQNPWEDR